jgi:hypothetical protein
VRGYTEDEQTQAHSQQDDLISVMTPQNCEDTQIDGQTQDSQAHSQQDDLISVMTPQNCERIYR